MATKISVQDVPDLRIAKNFLILSVLLYVLNVGISLFFPYHGAFFNVLSWGSLILFLATNVAGFYKLSKLARNQNLFKHYMLLVLSLAIFTALSAVLIKFFTGVWIFSAQNLQTALPAPSQTGGIFWGLMFLSAVIYVGLSVYWGYKLSFELSVTCGDNLFINGFKTAVAAVVTGLVANVVLSFSHAFASVLATVALVLFFAGFLTFAYGFFRLKEITLRE